MNDSLKEFLHVAIGVIVLVALIWASAWSSSTFSTPGEGSVIGIIIFFALIIGLAGAMFSGAAIIEANNDEKRRKSPGYVSLSWEQETVSRGRRAKWATYTGLFLAIPTILLGSAWADNGRQIRNEIVKVEVPIFLRMMVVGQASSGEIVLMPISENGRYPIEDLGFWAKSSDGCKVPVAVSPEVVAPSLRVKNTVLVAALWPGSFYQSCVNWPPKVLSVRPLLISQKEIDQVVAEHGSTKSEK